ncbi:hypothetical protein ABN356_02780 [Providencia rettgeri]|uniref:hypothetical protein n=1 Tax=Providencia rettgeri TaxID=587 RepID=UPI0023AB4EF0|nr:hypothetical protein [Providencia rettgeri]
MTDKPKSIPSGDNPDMQKPPIGVTVISSESLSINIKKILSIGIENIIDVESHNINKLYGSTSHFIKFKNGGHVELSYNEDGKLLDFSIHNLKTIVRDGNRILVRSN